MRPLLTLAIVAATSLPVQSLTTVSVEILSDGTCSIAVRGASGRSEMSYLPGTPGRCAIPVVRAAGAVRIEVLLPRGSAVPAGSIPALSWTVAEGRPRGVADLASPPEFVDVMPPARSVRSRILFTVFMLIAAAAAIRAFGSGRLQRRRG